MKPAAKTSYSKNVKGGPPLESQFSSTSESNPFRGFAARGKADIPAQEDHLDRTKYVNAIAALITHEKTEVPLTIGIYGEWGSGKSSFMKQLESLLRWENEIVTFNAWRYCEAEDLWTVLVSKVAAALDRQLPLIHRLKFLFFSRQASDARHRLNKACGRFISAAKKPENWALLAGAITGVLLYIRGDRPADIGIPVSGLDTIVSSVYFRASVLVISLFIIAFKLIRIILRPFSTQFAIYQSSSRADDTEKREMTQMDLNKISELFAIQKKVRKKIVVFLDDLDRCPPDKIVSVLEAVNLFFEGLPFVTVFGLSPKVVSRAIANQYEFLLDKDAGPLEREKFGQEFLQKIIHIPFQLPPVRAFESYMKTLVVHSSTGADKIIEKRPRYFGKEYLRRFPFWGKLTHYAYRLLLDEMTWLWRMKKLPAEKGLREEVVIRCLYGLESLPEHDDWLDKQPSRIQKYFHELRARAQAKPAFLDLKDLRNIEKKLLQDSLKEEIEVQQDDSDRLQRLSAHLYGNPRTIKRFVNVYQLMKGINAQLQGIVDKLEQQALWLVLFQNWPRESVDLYRHMSAEGSTFSLAFNKLKSTGVLSEDFERFANSDNILALDLLASAEPTFDVIGCFSFLSPYGSPGDQRTATPSCAGTAP